MAVDADVFGIDRVEQFDKLSIEVEIQNTDGKRLGASSVVESYVLDTALSTVLSGPVNRRDGSHSLLKPLHPCS
jgi:hypothetical protein